MGQHRRKPAGCRYHVRVCGFLSLDVALSIGLTALLAVAFAAAFGQCTRAQRLANTEMELRLAAETELLCLRAIGSEPTQSESGPQTTTRTLNDIVLETTMRPGDGVWSGLTYVSVVARKRLDASWVHVALFAYIPATEAHP